MSQASNTAGLVGKFGSTSFTSISRDQALPPRYPKPSKFFRSRNLKDTENVIEEEEAEEPGLPSTVAADLQPVEVPAQEAGRRDVQEQDDILEAEGSKVEGVVNDIIGADKDADVVEKEPETVEAEMSSNSTSNNSNLE